MTDVTHVLAVDPGKTTGLVLYDVKNQKLEYAMELSFDQTTTAAATAANEYRERLLIVSESFIITQHTAKNTQAPWSLELIGVMRYLSRGFTGRELFLQAPSSAKRFASDQRLKKLDLWTPGKGHANDAARHCLLLLATRGWLPSETLRQLATT